MLFFSFCQSISANHRETARVISACTDSSLCLFNCNTYRSILWKSNGNARISLHPNKSNGPTWSVNGLQSVSHTDSRSYGCISMSRFRLLLEISSAIDSKLQPSFFVMCRRLTIIDLCVQNDMTLRMASSCTTLCLFTLRTT